MVCCGVLYGGRYVWWMVARAVALFMVVLAGAMPGWSFKPIDEIRIGLYHTCMRAICTTTFDAAKLLTLEANPVLVVVNGVLTVLSPLLIFINIWMLTLDIGAKGRINGTKYKTFVILRNRAGFFKLFRDIFTFSEPIVVLANIIVYVVLHVTSYKDYQLYICFWVYLGAFLLLFMVDLHVLVVKCLHKRRTTPPENLWNPGILENPELRASWDVVLSNNI